MDFSLRESWQASLRSSLLILKLVVPLYLLADILLHYDLLSRISFLFTPLTSLLHLPAEAAMALAGGMLLNLYAAIAFAAPLGLSPYQWTVLGVFLGVCHSLPVESAVMQRLGVRVGYSVLLRVVMAFVCTLPVLLLPESFFGSQVVHQAAPPPAHETISAVLIRSFTGSLLLSVKIILLITTVIFFMDWLKSTRIMRAWSKKLNTSFSILIGQLLGITYGAGLLFREADAGNLGRADIFYIATFLMICHSVIEDALLFVLFGASYWTMVLVRLVMAFLVSFGLLRLFVRSSTLNHQMRGA